MSQLQVIEYKGQRVLTTAQLAEAFGTETKIVTNNFSRNKERYTEGKHYFELRGQELEAFKGSHQIDANLKFAPVLYLWTEKGAWLHAKSLNTDKAWEAYEMLVDDYYRVKQLATKTEALSPELQMFKCIFDATAKVQLDQVEQAKRLSVVEQRQEHITDVLSLNPTEWRKKTGILIERIAKARDDCPDYRAVRNESYEKLIERARCKLSTRLTNRKQRMALEGVAKSKIDKVNNLDVIAEDAKLTEIYLAIVKEMAIRQGVEVDIQELESSREEVETC